MWHLGRGCSQNPDHYCKSRPFFVCLNFEKADCPIFALSVGRLASPLFFIGPESDHWECLSLTDSLTQSLTHCCLVNLIDVTLACEDDNSNLLRLFLLFMLMMRNVLTTVWCRCGRWSLVIELSFCSDFEHKVSRFGQDFEVDVKATFWSWSLVIILLLMLDCGLWSSILVEILKVGLLKIFKFKFCRNANVWLRFCAVAVGAWSRFWRCLIKICVRTCDKT